MAAPRAQIPTGKEPAAPAWLHPVAVPALLILAAVLAVTSLLGDSITYDETSHLTAGMSYLKTGDFRLALDHPPLPKIWAAWPLLFAMPQWVPADDPGWLDANIWQTGRRWLFDLNDGERWLPLARGLMVVLLLALCAAIYAAGRRLFGPAAGLLALTVACLSPTLLAHGRLVTTDMPITLCTLLTLLTFGRLLQRLTLWRLLVAAVALGATSVSKMSWPLVLPALAAMALVAILRREPLGFPWATSAARRAGVLAAVAVVLIGTTLASIWTCYGWRRSIFPRALQAHAAFAAPQDPTRQLMQNFENEWRRLVEGTDEHPSRGPMAGFLRWARTWHLLPDAYLHGLAFTMQYTTGRHAYFCGQVSTTGWRSYFPVAIAIKTPVATLALILASLVALLSRGTGRVGDLPLLVGLLVFLGAYAAYVASSTYNIGHRHLLPIYPVLFVLAGASATWLGKRPGKWLVGAALVWLAGATWWIHPHYLSYFNEFVGGPSRGHLYLADSNLDWGQDLKRLARFARQHPNERIKLAYFGSADPTRYGFPCDLLPNLIGDGSPGNLAGGGLYVLSITELLGAYFPLAQDSFWQAPEATQNYRRLQQALLAPPRSESAESRRRAAEQFAALRWGRFLYKLRQRPPDERIGYSLWVYRLTPGDIEALTRP